MRLALRIFLKSSLSFCIGMTALWAIFAHAKLRAVFPELVGGSVIFGLVMTWLSIRVRGQYPASTDVSQTRVTRSLTLPVIPSVASEVTRRALNNLANIRIRSLSVEDGRVVAQTTRTHKSYGERISVSIRSAGKSESELEIISAPLIATTVIDQGKNRQNVDEIYQALMAASK
jgi:hypothetical protein